MDQAIDPEVSVVMGVYNAAASLPATLMSILDQTGCRLEFIVIDDGSTDGTAAILDQHAARDQRLRVFHQQNTGLTRALIRGCAEARGEFIARQDAGDLSLPGRLSAQTGFLREHAEAVMTGCAVRTCGPEGEHLYTHARPMMLLDAGLRERSPKLVRGPPHHGGTMFRRGSYLRAGGYRVPFKVAQDIDLWLRLAEQGPCLGMHDVYYQAHLEAGSISSRRRDEQLRMTELALRCASVRSAGQDDAAILNAKSGSRSAWRMPAAIERARFHYFIASCLRTNDPDRARTYFGKALRDNPLHLKAIFGWVRGR